MSRRRTTKKTPLIIVLSGLIPEEILSKYYDDDTEDQTPHSIINISEDGTVSSVSSSSTAFNTFNTFNGRRHPPQKQSARKNKRSMIFMNQYKNQSRMFAVMIDVTQNGALPRMTHRPCWWCRSSFSSIPVGCPIKYNKNTPGTLEAKRFDEYLKSINIVSDGSNDFFETEGIFCTLSCAKAYALDQLQRTSSPRYKDSLILLNLIKEKTDPCVGGHGGQAGHGSQDSTIPIAPSWKMIDEWGGHLTPREFRESFGLVEYKETINLRRPLLYSTSQYFQEKKIKI